MNIITDLSSALGPVYVVAGLLPALLFILAQAQLNSSTLGQRLPPWAPKIPELGTVFFGLSGEGLGTVTIGLLLWALIPVILGMLLMMLNNTLIQLSEGRPRWLRYTLLLPWQLCNGYRWKKEHEHFSEANEAYHDASLKYQDAKVKDQQQMHKNLANQAIKLTNAENRVFKKNTRRWPRFPTQREMVLPTAMGNSWAVIEEYPWRRYGMDGVLYWPRLLPLLGSELDDAPFASSLASQIASQKTIFDFLFHTALLTGVLGLEVVVLSLFDLSKFPPIYAFDVSANLGALVFGVGMLIVAYVLYRAAVSRVYVLGNFIASAYDLLRPALATALGLLQPTAPEQEYDMWIQMGLFLLRGRPHYHPNSLSKTPPQITESDNDQGEPEPEEEYRIILIKKASQE